MTMTSRERILAALGREPVDRPPVWIMRQAGRYLPEYRKLKEQYSFREMVASPDLATEVTLMPLRRFALDAAITFSDILVVPEALGIRYRFDNDKGISMERCVRSRKDVDALSLEGAAERLGYVYTTQEKLKRELAGEKALLGFSGTPWTLACYMVEGGGSTHYENIKDLAFSDPAALESLLETTAEAVAEYCLGQIRAGADAIQLFDSAAPGCPGCHYERWSLRWVRQVIEAIDGAAPVIYFVRGMGSHLDALRKIGADALSLDWTWSLPETARQVEGRIALQGNLDPVLLSGPPEPVQAECRKLLEGVSGHPGIIINLGHGILPSARIESVQALVNTVTGWEESS